jgi:hypothetical protein
VSRSSIGGLVIPSATGCCPDKINLRFVDRSG